MMDDILIKKCKKEDIPQLKDIYTECIQYHIKTGYHLDKVFNAPELFSDHAKELINRDDGLLIVAKSDNQIVGYCASKISEKPPVYAELRYGEIENLAVSRDFQRQGVGEKLFQETVKWLQKRNIKRIEIMVTIRNPKSNNFWQKMGFKTFMKTMDKEI